VSRHDCPEPETVFLQKFPCLRNMLLQIWLARFPPISMKEIASFQTSVYFQIVYYPINSSGQLL